MITLYDKLLFCGTVIISIILMIILNFFVYSGNPVRAIIEVDGKVYAEYNLMDIKNEQLIDVTTEYGSNKIMITSTEIKIVDASCKDKLDVLSKPISKPNQMIVCIPNHLTVRISGESDNPTNIDKVAY